MSSIRYLCLRSVLDFAQGDISHDLRTNKLQKEEFKNWRAQPIEKDLRPNELWFFRFLNQAQ